MCETENGFVCKIEREWICVCWGVGVETDGAFEGDLPDVVERRGTLVG